MAKATDKAAALTTLAIGKVEVSVGLFTAHADPKKKLVEFDAAGPSGGVLKMRSVARPVPVEEAVERPDEPVVRADPFGDDLFGGAPPPESPPALPSSRVGPDGEYGRELVEEGTGAVVAPQDVRRGVRLEDGRWIDCTDELKAIEQRTKLEKMDVVAFVDITHVPRSRGKGCYYVGAANEKAPPALRLLFEAMRRTRRGALVKLTKRSRQSLAIIAPHGDVLMLFELVWAEDFREPPARALVIQKASVSEAQVEQAVQLIRALSDSPAAIDELRDDAIELREDLYNRALRGEIEAMAADREAEQEDDELMAQLEASLAAVA